MNTPSTAFSERAQDRSYFFTTNLRLMSFLIWNAFAALLIAIFGRNVLIAIANARATPHQISYAIQIIGDNPQIAAGAIGASYILWSIVCGKRYWHTGPQRRAYQREWVRASFYIAMIASLISLIQLENPSAPIFININNTIHLNILGLLAALATAILYIHHAGFQDRYIISAARRIFYWIIAISGIGIASFICSKAIELYPSSLHLLKLPLSFAGLVSLIYLIYPQYFLTKQHAVWRNLWRAIRHDRIRSEYSPTGDLAHWINRIRRWRARNATQYNYYWLVLISALGGMLVIPAIKIASRFSARPVLDQSWQGYLLAFAHNIDTVISELWLDAGRDTALILAFLAISSVITRRQRYIFTPFNILEELKQEGKQEGKQEAGKNGIVGNKEAERMYSAAQHLTQQFIAQLEDIGCLLTTRQVDDVRSETRLPLAEFITSGGEGEFLAAIQSLVDIDERAKNIPGKLLAAITKLLAIITISGVLRRRDDVTLELEVRLTQRFGNQTSIIVPINLTHGSDDLVDDAIAANIARRAALRLLVRAGAVSHMASTEDSLEAFLDGLTASGAQNWWRAAASYQRAIDIEEARRGTFGLGRFHLGVSLLRQGEFKAALENMVQAERAGKPMAEVQHMLAVMRLHENWDRLDDEDKDATFEQLIRNARRATRSQRIFPEAHHLIGAAYYQRGKLIERAATRSYETAGERWLGRTGHAQQAYRRSIPALRTAIRQYRQRISRLQTQSTANPIIIGELERLRRDIMTATHQLGDSLRSTGDYALAETYYEDVLAAYPSNLRTLTDMAKMYVLAQSWQRADEFLAREVQSIPEGKWSADVQIYAGWAYAGGVNEWLRLNFGQRLALGMLAATWALWRRVNKRPQPGPQPLVTQLNEVLGRAVSHLDYAVYQRSRFAACWRQTDWQETLKSVLEWCYQHQKQAPTPSQNQVYQSGITDPTQSSTAPAIGNMRYVELWFRPSQAVQQLPPFYIVQLNAWLFWRLHQTGCERQLITSRFSPSSNMSAPPKEIYPCADLESAYIKLKELFTKTADTLEDIERSGRLRGIANTHRRLHIAELSLDNWKTANIPANNLLSSIKKRLSCTKTTNQHNNNVVTSKSYFEFADRWAFDIYAQISLLTTRLLAEAEAYEVAWIVATSSIHIISQYIDQWNEAYTSGFKLSPYVGRYQLATLHAWRAYSAQHLKQDLQARARLLVVNRSFLGFDDVFKDIPLYNRLLGVRDDLQRARILLAESEQLIEDDIKVALIQAPRHSLALWVDADRLHSNKQLNFASAAFQRLLEVLSPYDPNEYIANWHIIEKKRQAIDTASDFIDTKQNIHKQYRERLSKHERVQGRQQHYQIINQWNVNAQLADIFSYVERYDLSVQHLMVALTFSTHWDVDVDDLLLRLVQQLDRMDRLTDAHAVIGSMRSNRQILAPDSLSIAKQYLPDMWQCIIHTRRREYAQSLTLGKELRRRLEESQQSLQKNRQEVYKKRIPAPIKEDEKNDLENLIDAAISTIKSHLQPIRTPWPSAQQADWAQCWDNGLIELVQTLQRENTPLAVILGIGSPLQRVRGIDFKSIQATSSNSNQSTRPHIRQQFPVLNIHHNLIVHLINILAIDTVSLRHVLAQLNNNHAYNLIELRLGDVKQNGTPGTAWQTTSRMPLLPQPGSSVAVRSSKSHDARSLVDLAIQETERLQHYRFLLRGQEDQLKRELAYYHDTRAWHSYRLARHDQPQQTSAIDHLRQAQRDIDQALEIEQRSAIIYYHAARITLALLERAWQDSMLTSAPPTNTAPLRNNAAAPAPPLIEPVLENYLFAIHHYWTQARAHDYDGRFRSDLTWIGLRLDEYRQTLKGRVKPTRSP